MRSRKELLEFMLNNLEKDSLLIGGLCDLNLSLHVIGEIDYFEYNEIKTHLVLNAPEGIMISDFWWSPGEKQPRIDWLKKQIEKL